MTFGLLLRGKLERQGSLLGSGRRSVLGLLGDDDPLARGRVVEAERRVEFLAENDRQGLQFVGQ